MLLFEGTEQVLRKEQCKQRDDQPPGAELCREGAAKVSRPATDFKPTGARSELPVDGYDAPATRRSA
eukprot:3019730-Amphidinium_carterae.1